MGKRLANHCIGSGIERTGKVKPLIEKESTAQSAQLLSANRLRGKIPTINKANP